MKMSQGIREKISKTLKIKSKKGVENHRFIHGMKTTRFYHIWESMRSRCLNKNHCAYNRYGGRGITIKWKSFVEFRNDMYESYLSHVRDYEEKDTTIDRINNDGNYCKENCKWSTRKEQSSNRSDLNLVTYSGKTMCMYAWERELGFPIESLSSRFRKGWNIEKIFSTPLRSLKGKKHG